MSRSRHIENTSNYNLTWDCRRNEILIRVRLEWNFDSDLNETERGRFRQRFSDAVIRKWNSHGYHLEAQQNIDGSTRTAARGEQPRSYSDPQWDLPLDTHGLPPNVNFRYQLIRTTSGEHWDVEVSRHSERSNVNRLSGNINVGLNDSDWVCAHEFGHALGLPDEYDECVHGGRTWGVCHIRNWTRPSERFGDQGGLMSIGPALRARYFFDIRNRLNRWTGHRYMFQLRPLRDGDSAAEDARAPARTPDWNEDIGSAAWGGA